MATNAHTGLRDVSSIDYEVGISLTWGELPESKFGLLGYLAAEPGDLL